jgi:hypothetical protein
MVTPHLKYFASLNAVDGTCALLQKLRGKLSKGGESASGYTANKQLCNGDLWYEACYWMDQKNPGPSFPGSYEQWLETW